MSTSVHAPPPPARPAASSRALGLDAVRALMMALGVAYHATWAYMPGIGRWYLLEDASTSAWMAPLAALLHAFRMETFFALSGYVAHLAFTRHGALGFLQDRARRLGGPLAVALPLLVAVDLGTRQWALSAGRLSPDYPWGAALLVRPLHLWFLEYLLLFSLAAAVVRQAWPASDGASMRLALRRPWLLLGLAAVTFAVRELLGEATPAFSPWPQPAALAHYGLFFAFGWALWSAGPPAQQLGRGAGAMLAGGLGLVLLVVTRELQWQPRGHALLALGTWACVLGWLGLGLRAQVPERARRPLAAVVDASYWVYLAHYPVVLTLQLALAPLAWSAAAKFAVVVLGALGVTAGLWGLGVRQSEVGRALGARRPGG